MICPVKLANEMSGLSGTLNSNMTGCGHKADERSRYRRVDDGTMQFETASAESE